MVMHSIKRFVRRSPRLGRALGTYYRLFSKPFHGSQEYWIERYEKGGHSGLGSYGPLARFKGEVLSAFVREERIKSVIEFGCGDGQQLSRCDYPEYLGLDVSPAAVAQCRARFASDPRKRFRALSQYAGETAELALSVGVIQHLIENRVYREHLRGVFGAATRFVAIYSTNHDGPDDAGLPHVRHRHFTEFVERELRGWALLHHALPPAPDSGDRRESSPAEFFFFEKA